jgi:hypothetical protein
MWVTPRAIAPIKNALCEIDLSPGIQMVALFGRGAPMATLSTTQACAFGFEALLYGAILSKVDPLLAAMFGGKSRGFEGSAQARCQFFATLALRA